jgi:hypothetical protein
MKLTRLILIVLSAMLLQGCITYYYPAYEPGATDNYAEDEYSEADYFGDEAYDLGTPIVDLRVISAAYYPWWSMDYYYLGPHYYRPAYFGYTSGWYSSFGYLNRYPPFYSPYGIYGPIYYPSPFINVYQPWYDPWFGWPGYSRGPGYIWYDSFWSGRYQAYADKNLPRQDDQQAFGISLYDTRVRQSTDSFADPRDRADYRPRQAEDRREISRSVSMSPALGDGNQGMEVRSRRERKVQEAHIGPAPVSSSRTVSSTPRVIRQVQSPQVRSVSPARPVASSPQVIRQVQSRSAITPGPGVRPPTSSAIPSRPSPIPGPASGAPAPYPKAGSNRHNN